MARWYLTARARMSDETGAMLIEVLATAVLVVVVAVGVLAGFDSASKASGRSKAKSIAANLAQQDQERLRGMPPKALLQMAETSTTVPVDGVSYTVTSKSEYRLENSITPGCTGGQRDERLGIVSTVSWPNRGATAPVRIESLIAPPLDSVSATQGNAVIRITGRDGITATTPGKNVALVGPSPATGSVSATTGPEGCAFFANFQTGSYRFTHTTPDWTDPAGNAAIDLPVSIVANATRSADVLYEPDSDVVAQYYSRYTNASGTLNYYADQGEAVTVEHTGIPVGSGRRVFSSSTAATKSVGPLFPFATPYVVYSGACDTNELPPRTGAPFSGLTSTYATALTAVAGENGTTYRVFEPALNVTVRSGTPASSTVVNSGATVRFKSTVAGCTYSQQKNVVTGGRVQYPGLPYGTYEVCALRNGRKATATYTNNVLDGQNFTMYVDPGSAGGQTCPA